MTNDLSKGTIEVKSEIATTGLPTEIEKFKSIYYLIKGKRDTDIKLYKEYKTFSFDDVVELNDRVYKKLELHTIITNINIVTLSLSNKEIKSFGSWNEFLNFNRSISSGTKCLSIEWDFNLLLPNQSHSIPQTHTLRVRIGNELKPSEMIQVFFGAEAGETDLEEAQAQMVCKIDFVNAQICNELKTIVSEWYDALPKNSEEHTIIKNIIKHKKLIEEGIIFLFTFAGVIFINYIFGYYLLHHLTSNALLFSTSISFLVILIFYRVGFYFANKTISKNVENLKRDPMFLITKGDTNRVEENKKDNHKLLKRLGIDIVVTLGVNLVVLIFGTLLPWIITQLTHLR